MEEQSPYRLVYCTCGSAENARQIADAVVSEQLAACVNILPGIQSVYRWQGQVESANEWLLLIKTRTECLLRLQERVKSLHTYELPEIIAVPIASGYEPYLTWITESVTPHEK